MSYELLKSSSLMQVCKAHVQSQRGGVCEIFIVGIQFIGARTSEGVIYGVACFECS